MASFIQHKHNSFCPFGGGGFAPSGVRFFIAHRMTLPRDGREDMCLNYKRPAVQLRGEIV